MNVIVEVVVVLVVVVVTAAVLGIITYIFSFFLWKDQHKIWPHPSLEWGHNLHFCSECGAHEWMLCG